MYNVLHKCVPNKFKIQRYLDITLILSLTKLVPNAKQFFSVLLNYLRVFSCTILVFFWNTFIRVNRIFSGCVSAYYRSLRHLPAARTSNPGSQDGAKTRPSRGSYLGKLVCQGTTILFFV